jgi:formate C-acetyltransferase
VQFNCIDSNTLKKAKANPEEYRGLLVRVAGYSAFYVELDDSVQEDIINRTEFSEVG